MVNPLVALGAGQELMSNPVAWIAGGVVLLFIGHFMITLSGGYSFSQAAWHDEEKKQAAWHDDKRKQALRQRARRNRMRYY